MQGLAAGFRGGGGRRPIWGPCRESFTAQGVGSIRSSRLDPGRAARERGIGVRSSRRERESVNRPIQVSGRVDRSGVSERQPENLPIGANSGSIRPDPGCAGGRNGGRDWVGGSGATVRIAPSPPGASSRRIWAIGGGGYGGLAAEVGGGKGERPMRGSWASGPALPREEDGRGGARPGSAGQKPTLGQASWRGTRNAAARGGCGLGSGSLNRFSGVQHGGLTQLRDVGLAVSRGRARDVVDGRSVKEPTRAFQQACAKNEGVDSGWRQLWGGEGKNCTYAAALTGGGAPRPFFPEVKLKGRQVQSKEGAPMIVFAENELNMAFRSMEFALVVKFTPARPKVKEIVDHIQRSWRLEGQPYVGALDGKHALIICRSEKDAVEGLTCESRRMGSALFRIFRWSPDFSPNAELASAAVWVKLHGLDPCFFRSSFLREICRGIGRFLKVDEATLSLANPAVARVCVEVNMARPLVQGFWVGSSERQKWVGVDYEGRMDFCGKCKKHGHIRVDCRKWGRGPVEKASNSSRPDVISEDILAVPACQGGDVRATETVSGGWTVVQRKRRGACARDSQMMKTSVSRVSLGSPSDQNGQGGAHNMGHHGSVGEGDQEQEVLSCMELSLAGKGDGCREVNPVEWQVRTGQLPVPQMVVRNVKVQPYLHRKMQDSIEECMERLFEHEKRQSQATMYRRMLSVDDSALGCSSTKETSQVRIEEVEEAGIEPLRISFRPDWHSGLDLDDERVAQLRLERDQSRRTTRSATKLKSPHTS